MSGELLFHFHQDQVIYLFSRTPDRLCGTPRILGKWVWENFFSGVKQPACGVEDIQSVRILRMSGTIPLLPSNTFLAHNSPNRTFIALFY